MARVVAAALSVRPHTHSVACANATLPRAVQMNEGMSMLWHHLKGCSRDAAYDGAAHTFDQQLKRQLLALHAVQRSSSHGAGNPIAEQLGVVESLPEEERMDAAVALLRAWVRD